MSRFLKQQYRLLDAYVPGEQPRDRSYIKLNTNESPYPPAPQVLAAITEQTVADLRLYSDPAATRLKEKLAALYGVEKAEIFVSNGSDDVLNFAFMAFGGDGAVFPDITYGFYPVFCRLHGVPFRQIPLREDLTLDPLDYCGVGAMVAIANPNAPTGLSIRVEQIRQILQTNPDHVVLIDEAYVDFGGESCLDLIREYGNLLVVRTFSKSRSLAGGRLGYAFGAPALIQDLEKLRYCTNPFDVNALTQKLGEATVDGNDYYMARCADIIRTREWTAAELIKLGFAVLPSKTNFLFAAHPAISGGALYRRLKENGILIRHFDSPRTRDYIRLTVGTAEQMEIFVDTVRGILEGTL